MHKSACQSDCVATARPSWPLLPLKQPRVPATRTGNGPRRIYSPSFRLAELIEIFCQLLTARPRNAERRIGRVGVDKLTESPSTGNASKRSTTRFVRSDGESAGQVGGQSRGNERRAWSINHTFVGITPARTYVYVTALARSKGNPRFTPAGPRRGNSCSRSGCAHASTLTADT